jgi:hypothetical protein
MIPVHTQFDPAVWAGSPAAARGVLTQNGASSSLNIFGVQRVNDGIYTGRAGAYQRYSASPQAAQVVTNPYGGM